MKILTANIGLGVLEMSTWVGQIRTSLVFCRWKFIPFIVLRGRTLWGLFNYTMTYNNRQLSFLKRKSTLAHICALVETESPEVLIVNELIRELHKEEFETFLIKKGYATIGWGSAKHAPGATVSTVVASKLPGTSFSLDVHQVSEISGGGGFVGVRLQDTPVSILGGHFTNSRRTLSRQQIEDIAAVAKEEMQNGRTVVIAGDFNETGKRIRDVRAFEALGLTSCSHERTFPTMLPAALRRDLDHIFISDHLRVRNARTIAFGSDHLAVIAEVET